MHLFEVTSILLSSGVFLGILALFYRFGRNQERTDNNFRVIMDKINAMDNRLSSVEKDIQQLNTRTAVIESKIADISTNVSHLMWHNQSLPPKEAGEQ